MTMDLTAAAVADLRSIRDYTVETWVRNRKSNILTRSGTGSKRSRPIR